MKIKQSYALRIVMLSCLVISLTVLSSRIKADTGSCGGVSITLPFTDVMSSPFFCQIAAAYYSGLTNGTTATTYSPAQPVTREQMAAFISRTLDQSLKRGSKKAVTEKWWTPQNAKSLGITDVGDSPQQVKFDGTDLWVANAGSGSVMRIRPSDGKLLGTWTGASGAEAIVAAMGKIFVAAYQSPGSLYMIDPTQPGGAVTTLSSFVGQFCTAIAFDGSRLWTANHGGSGGSVCIISLNPTTVTTITTGFDAPTGILYDGSNIWVTDTNKLLKLNSDGSIAQTINMGNVPRLPVFDGTNIWVPNLTTNPLQQDYVSVVRVKDALGNPLTTAFEVATLTGNGLNSPHTATFDGERIMVTNLLGDSVSMWKAADLTPLGSFSTGLGSGPYGVCSDGVNFWITLKDSDKLARF